MRAYLLLTILVVTSTVIHALPVKEKKEEHKEESPKEGEEQGEDWELNLEYGRYLKEVVQALESDPAFRKKLETAEVDDIKSGKIARELHFVDHNVRTKLDELKRRELERLRHLAIKEHEKETGVNRNLLKVPAHVDYINPTRFEVEDLKKLIVKTTEDLEKVDAQRRDDFKKYELEKEFERQQELAAMDEEHRKQAEQKHDEEVGKHKQHEKLHHPGSKQQLEEVWEEQDHMRAEDFNPKTFFKLHDLDGNGYWDEMEVKALFKKELDKMYDPNASEDDMNERYEEMERMREHVFKESDNNRDNLISFEEFVEQTKRAEFEQDGGWQGLDEQEMYSQQEYDAYQRQREEEIRRLVEAGAIPPPPGYHGNVPMHPAVYQGGPYPGPPHPAAAQGLPPPHAVPAYGVQPQIHPNAVPQVYQNVPQGYQAVHPGQGVPQGYQVVPGQVAPQGYQVVPGQVAPQGYQAVPQGHQVVPGQGAPQGYQAVPQGQAIPQGYQVVPQGVAQAQSQLNVQNIPQESSHQVPSHQQPIAGQPVQAQPLAGQPVVGQPVQGQPMAAQSVHGQPVAAQPVQGQPVAGQPIQGQQVVGVPVPAAHPAVGQAPVAGQNFGQQALPNVQSNALH